MLLDEAERIRGELIVLAGQAEQLEQREGQRRGADAVRSVLAAAARRWTRSPARSSRRRAVDEHALSPVRGQVDAALAVLGEHGLAGRSVAARVRVFTGQLRAAVETARTGAGEGREPEPDDVRGVARLRDPIAVLRANLIPDAAVLRHAVRAAVLVAGSDAVVRLAGVARGYWIPLTIMVTLRPDFATTFQRSSMRIVGHDRRARAGHRARALRPGRAVVERRAGRGCSSSACASPVRATSRCSPISLAALVVVLLSLAGQSPHSTVVPRGVDTLIGGALALLGTLLWPVVGAPPRAGAARRAARRLPRLPGRARRSGRDIADRLRRLRSAARAGPQQRAGLGGRRTRRPGLLARPGRARRGGARAHAPLRPRPAHGGRGTRHRTTARRAHRTPAATCWSAVATAILHRHGAPKHAPRVRPIQERFVASAARTPTPRCVDAERPHREQPGHPDRRTAPTGR